MNVVSGGSRWHLCSGVLLIDVVYVGAPYRGALNESRQELLTTGCIRAVVLVDPPIIEQDFYG
jgi:hypothetical protein